MTARAMSHVIASSVVSTLTQLPPAVLAELEIAGIAITSLASAIGNNAALVIAMSDDELEAA